MKEKVMIIGPVPPPPGGVATLTHTLLNSSLKDRYSLSVLDISKKKKMRYTTGGVPSFLSPFYLLIHLIKLNYLLYKEKATIIHLQSTSDIGFLRDSLFIMFGILWKKRIICHFHGALAEEYLIFKYNILRSYFRFIMNYVDVFIPLSKSFALEFDSLIPQTKKIVIPNFISQVAPKEFNPVKENFKSEITILFVGRLSEKKGIYDLLKAAVILKDVPYICFQLAGLGETEADEKRIASELDKNNIKRKVNLLGYIQGQEKANLFASSDIFVLPSYTEVFPMVILEAMSAGMPVIATPVGAIPDIIEEDVNGFIVPQGNYQLLAEKILYLVRNPQKRIEMGRNNFQKFKQEYSVEINVDRIDKIYQSLLQPCKR